MCEQYTLMYNTHPLFAITKLLFFSSNILFLEYNTQCGHKYFLWKEQYYSLYLNFFQLLARKPNLEKNSIFSNNCFHNFHLSKYSFTCTGLRAGELVQRLILCSGDYGNQIYRYNFNRCCLLIYFFYTADFLLFQWLYPYLLLFSYL